MAREAAEEPLTKVTIRLWSKDYSWLRLHGYEYNDFIRRCLRNEINRHEINRRRQLLEDDDAQ